MVINGLGCGLSVRFKLMIEVFSNNEECLYV